MFREYFHSILSGLESLALDLSCLSCGLASAPLCETCVKSWRKVSGLTRECDSEIHFSYAYNEVASKIVMKAKEDGIQEAKNFLTHALADSLTTLIERNPLEVRELIIVPVPSTSTARRRRGEDFIFELAKDVRKILQPRIDTDQLKVRRLLRVNRQISDQARLSEFERGRNLVGAFRVVEKLDEPIPIIVIDDVITTGSTIREAFRALKERNLTVIGGATACASKRRLPIRYPSD